MSGSPAVKRGFDVVASLAGLVVLSPVIAGVALVVLADLGRPVLFRQQRVGLGGALFTIHKFRTMRPARGASVTAADDPRIGRFGRTLRRTRLDELPQLWDVLRGAMSLVGPRPEVPDMMTHYPAEARGRILSVRPGITDPATLAFRREEEMLAQSSDPERLYIEEIIPRKVAMHLDYIDRQSLGLDLAILTRTAAALFRQVTPRRAPR